MGAPREAISFSMKRFIVLTVAMAAVTVAAQPARSPSAHPQPFTVVEATIRDMQRAMQDRRVTSRDLVTQYLGRIALYEKHINTAISINPHVLHEADARDAERALGHVRGPLHGIPIALKDNIHTIDEPTTGGALAFANFTPPYDATLTKNLRAAGAIIIAKTVMTELANWVAGPPALMPGTYSAIGSFAFNPYDPRPDLRGGINYGQPLLSTGGSSSGSGTASSFWAANVGTDSAGSIVNPAELTMLVGLRPTTGRISRRGIIPVTLDQDTAGPMARTVSDAAILLGALESPSPDRDDPATTRCTPAPGRDYTKFLKPGGLRGARIGIPRAFYYQPVTPPTEKAPRGGLTAGEAKLMAYAIDVLKREGATVVDPADLPSVVDPEPSRNVLLFNICAGFDDKKGQDAHCSVVVKYGMKRDFNAYLATLGPSAPVKSLTDLRLFNLTHRQANAIRYGQSNLDISDEMDVRRDRARYEADRSKDLRLAGERGLKAAIAGNKLDALLFPGWNVSLLASRPGYPEIAVPVGLLPVVPVPHRLVAELDPRPVPYGAAFVGPPCSEPRLIEIAYAFEQATKRRVPPPEMP